MNTKGDRNRMAANADGITRTFLRVVFGVVRMNIDDAFTSAHVKRALEAIDNVERVMVAETPTDDTSVFEVYPAGEEFDSDVESVIESEFAAYGPSVSYEQTAGGGQYIRMEVTGLIKNAG